MTLVERNEYILIKGEFVRSWIASTIQIRNTYEVTNFVAFLLYF